MAQAVIKIIIIASAVAILIIVGVLWLLAMALHRYGQMVEIEQQRKEMQWHGKKK